ncbi:aldose epimerase [Paenibacillus humicola]|uniref:aldose epimerase family protein n=1 Tax=Paenibacillus humicola TaxID=3110540 RepID=UPI00237B8586|nr:aldose epimerase [Paenibacillus humicola]
MSRYEVLKHEDTYTLYTLTDAETDSSVTVCPERGAIATGCRLFGTELFYLDRETFLDPEANVRGGNPVLFPICGQLEDGRYEWEGAAYSMRNHGVARNRPWETVSTSADGEASVTVRLRSDEGTRAEYPFDFELLFTFALKDGRLHIRQTYKNLSERPMPYYAGFHPYFKSDSKRIPFRTDATRYLDYNDHVVKPVPADGSIDLNGLKESVALLDARERRIAFPGPDGITIEMSYSDAFKYVVLWQVNGKPFVCVEPWMALTGELNRNDELPMLEAGPSAELELTIGCRRD